MQYEMELNKEKEAQMQKRYRLKELHENDIKLKQQTSKDREAVFSSTDDFKDNNIMSYCFNKKANKSYELGRRNDKIINIIRSQFTANEDHVRLEDIRIQKYRERKNKEISEMEAAKNKTRKMREMEIKKFQDEQVELKQKARDDEQKRKMQDHNKLKKEYERYQEENSKRKEQIQKRNKEHQHIVLEQMKEEPRTFAKTGVAIINH